MDASNNEIESIVFNFIIDNDIKLTDFLRDQLAAQYIFTGLSYCIVD